MARKDHAPFGAALFLALAACGPGLGDNAASSALKRPEMPTDTQAKCKVAKSQAEPLIVEWPETQRAKLESLRKRGLLAVHYEGCELSMLSQCRVKGTYGYSGITRKQSRVTIKDADELYASMPAFAVKLEGKLKSAGQLNVQMTLVGRYEAEGPTATTADLEGDCAGATHVVSALTVGAFTFFAGADAEVGGSATVMGAGGGAKSTANRELLQRDGDEASCAHSAASDKLPPEGCGAALQLEVIPLAAAKSGSRGAIAAAAPPPYGGGQGGSEGGITPIKKKDCKAPMFWDGERCMPRKSEPAPIECPSGEHLEGRECVKDRPTRVSCSEDEVAEGGRCVTRVITCKEGEHREGRQCVANPPPPTPADPVRPILGLTAGAGLAVGLVGGALAMSNASEAKKSCNESTKVCSPDALAKKDTAVTIGWVSTVGFGVSLLSGAAWLLWPTLTGSSKTKGGSSGVSVAPLPGGAAVSASGRFSP